ncbi:craniofacial development protein 2-like [Polyergus mexicanus]|uniref:craniofacial development protein 2-like n=1 Tax=Polyergus mexicanus TaxID=615972 RepID=UPI0038B55591
MSNSETNYPRRVELKSQNLALSRQSASRILGEAKARLIGKKKTNNKTLYIAGYNIRTMRLEEHLSMLEEELNKIKWDVIGLTRLKGETVTTLESGHVLFQKNSDVNAHVGGVALLQVQYSGNTPTSASTDEEHEKFLENLTTAKSAEKTRFTIMTGDFNSKIGQKTQTDPPYIGTFGLGERNQRGQEMMNFFSKEKIYCMNTFFKKHPKRKWT